MFSMSPFLIDYERPKSYALFDDDYYPFSRNRYYVGQQAPSPFGRSFSSFRRPSSAAYCPASFYQPAASFYQSKPERPPKNESDDELSDPFLDLFGLRPQKTAAKRKESGPKEIKQHQQDQPKKLKSSEVKVLDSQRFDTESETEFRFVNYKCTDPAGIDVRITKENYIELRTADGYTWKSRLADNVGDLQKASCTLNNGVLSLKLPKRQPHQQPVSAEETRESPKKNEQLEEKKEEKEEQEFDPDAPIVEDILEEMD